LEIKKNVSLKDKNWFQTGGDAEYFCEPTTAVEFQEALQFAKDKNLEVTLLGLGANVLISDDGVEGLVIRPAMRTIELVQEKDGYGFIKTGAGVTIHQLIEWSLSHSFIGLEMFSAIPGTVGGSVYNNLHYFKDSFSDFIVEAEVIHKKTGEIKTVDNDWFGFGYDQSTLHERIYFLVSATFRFKKGTESDITDARKRRAEITKIRVTRYPCARTCGCFFKNCDVSDAKEEVDGKKMLSAGYYLDRLGYKGSLRVGGAMVSPQHANMIITDDTATSADIFELAQRMQEGVKDEFGFNLQPECIFLGFKEI